MWGKTGLLFVSTYYTPIQPEIVPVISAICFLDFTSEKWVKMGNYPRFLRNYARIPVRYGEKLLSLSKSLRRRTQLTGT